MMIYIKSSIILAIVFLNTFYSNAQIPSIGDKEYKLDTCGFFPYSKSACEWIKAGVEDGVPPYNSFKNVYHAKPSNNLQKIIDKAARKGGVVLLAKGDYVVDKSLNLRSGVVLRGESKNDVRLLVKLKGQFWRIKNSKRTGAILLHGIERAGIENLTVRYDAADFEPNNPDSFDSAWRKDVFHRPETRDTCLFVEQIWINQSRNCWVQDCRILWAGSDPIRITLSDHITCRRNYIDRCYNKNDGGMGYYNISNSRYVLVANDTVRRIRHFAIQNDSKFNVVKNNYFEVDINFHDGDAGYNLIVGNTVRIPQWHSWNPIARGVPEQHLPPGKGNILINNTFINKQNQRIYSEPNVFFELSNRWEGDFMYTIGNKKTK